MKGATNISRSPKTISLGQRRVSKTRAIAQAQNRAAPNTSLKTRTINPRAITREDRINMAKTSSSINKKAVKTNKTIREAKTGVEEEVITITIREDRMTR